MIKFLNFFFFQKKKKKKENSENGEGWLPNWLYGSEMNFDYCNL